MYVVLIRQFQRFFELILYETVVMHLAGKMSDTDSVYQELAFA